MIRDIIKDNPTAYLVENDENIGPLNTLNKAQADAAKALASEAKGIRDEHGYHLQNMPTVMAGHHVDQDKPKAPVIYSSNNVTLTGGMGNS